MITTLMGNRLSELKANIRRKRFKYAEVRETQSADGVNAIVLDTPRIMLATYPLNENCIKFVASYRNILREVLSGKDQRRIVFFGKKFISPADFDHFIDEMAGRKDQNGTITVVVVHLTFDHDIDKVRKSCRRALKRQVALGFNLTCAILGQYFGDMACCVTVDTIYNAGLASASSSPALCCNEAIREATKMASTFVGVSQDGQICAFQSDGNPHAYALGTEVIATNGNEDDVPPNISVFISPK